MLLYFISLKMMNRREFLEKGFEGIIVGISLFYYCEKNPVKSGEFYTEYNIEKCLQLKSIAGRNEANINITVQDNTILFDHFLDTYCNALIDNYLTLEFKVEENLIEVSETFDGESVARCICSFPIKGKISNLEKKEYTVKFIYKIIVGDKINTSILYERNIDLR